MVKLYFLCNCLGTIPPTVAVGKVQMVHHEMILDDTCCRNHSKFPFTVSRPEQAISQGMDALLRINFVYSVLTAPGNSRTSRRQSTALLGHVTFNNKRDVSHVMSSCRLMHACPYLATRILITQVAVALPLTFLPRGVHQQQGLVRDMALTFASFD
jgi:hypothetical protein